ncbi:MAG TPA: hypothetical protein VGM28_09585 [Candidatus Limnocylindrales bacterium]
MALFVRPGAPTLVRETFAVALGAPAGSLFGTPRVQDDPGGLARRERHALWNAARSETATTGILFVAVNAGRTATRHGRAATLLGRPGAATRA